MAKSTIERRIYNKIKYRHVKIRRLQQGLKKRHWRWFQTEAKIKAAESVQDQVRNLELELEEYETALDVVREVSNPARGGQARRQT